jgi:hypothetical protein
MCYSLCHGYILEDLELKWRYLIMCYSLCHGYILEDLELKWRVLIDGGCRTIETEIQY